MVAELVDSPIETNHKLRGNVGKPVEIERYQILIQGVISLWHTKPDINCVVRKHMHNRKNYT